MAANHIIGDFAERVTTLPPNKRYICTHPPWGASITAPSPPQLYHGRAGVGDMARSYSATSAPAILAHDADIAACTSARAGPRATATRTSSARAAAPAC